MISSISEQLVSECEGQKWTQQLKDCILASTGQATLMECQKYAPPPPSGGSTGHVEIAEDEWEDDGDFKPTPRGPAPVWDGKASDCNAVATHATAFYLWQSSGDAEVSSAVAEMKAELEGEILRMCTTDAWSEAARMCVLNAGSEEDFDRCGEMIDAT
jgi:hypothetical protein